MKSVATAIECTEVVQGVNPEQGQSEGNMRVGAASASAGALGDT